MNNIYIFCYWYDQKFNNIIGGPVKVFDLANNLVKEGDKVFLFIPKLGNPKKQCIANIIEIPVINYPVLRPLSFNFFAFLCAGFISFRAFPSIIYMRMMSALFPYFLSIF